jgi:hypothetical protein
MMLEIEISIIEGDADEQREHKRDFAWQVIYTRHGMNQWQ